MNYHSNSTISSFNNLEKLEEFTLKNRLFSNDIPEILEISDLEMRILNWLDENGVVHGIPEEKEYAYYENIRNKAPKSFHRIHIESSPLLQRRRSSLPNGSGSPLKRALKSKLSKFQICKCSGPFCRCSMKME